MRNPILDVIGIAACFYGACAIILAFCYLAVSFVTWEWQTIPDVWAWVRGILVVGVVFGVLIGSSR
jgi:hypothetical protein